jgi:hypothetical protein
MSYFGEYLGWTRKSADLENARESAGFLSCVVRASLTL